jgi:hypothetical protein
MLKRVPLYFFPIYLCIAEYCLREFLVAEPVKARAPAPWSIFGPSIAAAGIALLFPVVVPRPPTYQLPPRAQAALNQRNLAIYSISDQRVTTTAWIVLVILTGVWAATLYIAQKNPPIEWWSLIPVTLVIGGIAYIAGIILTELKGIP